MYLPHYLQHSALRAAFHAAFFPRVSHIPERVRSRAQCIADILQTAQRDDKNVYDLAKEVWEPILMLYITSPRTTVGILDCFIHMIRQHPNAHRLESISTTWQKVMLNHPSIAHRGCFLYLWKREWDQHCKTYKPFNWYNVLRWYTQPSSWGDSYLLSPIHRRERITEWEHIRDLYNNVQDTWKYHQWLRLERFDDLFHGWRRGTVPLLEFHAAIAHRPFYCVMIER